jgi:hypothetical protein
MKQNTLSPIKESLEWKPDLSKAKKKKPKKDENWKKEMTIIEVGGRLMVGIPTKFTNEFKLRAGMKVEYARHPDAVATLDFDPQKLGFYDPFKAATRQFFKENPELRPE